MSTRVYNFNPGPAVLPEEVLKTAQEDLWSFRGTGMGILEISHRSADFEQVLAETEANIRELLGVPNAYAVIFTTGGASNQFSMVPMNLLRPGTKADYLITGYWAKKAADEAKKFGEVHIASDSTEEKFASIPKKLNLSEAPAYVHFTSNNTIVGTQYRTEPDAGNAVLVCDASSDILSRRIDVTKYGLIYAGAQKNLGPAGVTLVIIHRDLLERSKPELPAMMNYNTYVKSNSLYNTPPVFAIYVMGEVLKWIKKSGGLEQIENQNREKAALLYDCIDNLDSYYGMASAEDRSWMNVTFRLASDTLETTFLKEAKARGLIGLKGHREFGGMRASIYNAFPKKGVEELVAFMKEFAKIHGR